MTNESRSLCTQCRILILPLSSPLLSAPLSHHSHSAAAIAATAQWRIIIDRTRKTLARSPVRVRQHKRREEGEDTTTMMFLISSSECTAHRTRVTRTMEAPYEEEGEEAEQLQS